VARVDRPAIGTNFTGIAANFLALDMPIMTVGTYRLSVAVAKEQRTIAAVRLDVVYGRRRYGLPVGEASNTERISRHAPLANALPCGGAIPLAPW
jgi:hypothetical protein